jgi:hypothetical protein
LASKKFLELLENVSERVGTGSSRAALTSELVIEAFESGESLLPTEASTEWPALRLLLLITIHASLIIKLSLLFFP